MLPSDRVGPVRDGWVGTSVVAHIQLPKILQVATARHDAADRRVSGAPGAVRRPWPKLEADGDLGVLDDFRFRTPLGPSVPSPEHRDEVGFEAVEVRCGRQPSSIVERVS